MKNSTSGVPLSPPQSELIQIREKCPYVHNYHLEQKVHILNTFFYCFLQIEVIYIQPEVRLTCVFGV